jgi:homoserine/homoserine lactone efflux protein
MSWDVWLLFFGTEMVLSLSPGPAVLFVVAQGLRGGARLALAATCGVLLANSLWFALSAVGLGAVLVAMPGLLTVVRWIGAAYIGWLGIAALRGGGPLAKSDGGGTEVAFGAVLRRGLSVQLSNPKALVFFTAILPGFVDPSAAWSPWFQVLVFAVTSIGSEFWVLLGYGVLAGAASARLRDPRWARSVDRAAGLLLLLVAVWIALRA